MNYQNPDILHPLAERYVLGTMTRLARRRFNRLIDNDANILASVFAVEEMLLPLAWSQPPVQPSALVWQRIIRETRIDGGRRRAAFNRSTWPLLAAAIAMAFIVATLGWWRESLAPPDVIVETVFKTVPLQPAIGVFSDDDGAAIWVARVYDDLKRVDVSVNSLPVQRDNNDYQLWILRDDGVPVSLGLLPQSGNRSLLLENRALDALARGSTLAVSLEPLGGSPEPVPTGTVLYTAALLAPLDAAGIAPGS